jgi:hypothetical protein
MVGKTRSNGIPRRCCRSSIRNQAFNADSEGRVKTMSFLALAANCIPSLLTHLQLGVFCSSRTLRCRRFCDGRQLAQTVFQAETFRCRPTRLVVSRLECLLADHRFGSFVLSRRVRCSCIDTFMGLAMIRYLDISPGDVFFGGAELRYCAQ